MTDQYFTCVVCGAVCQGYNAAHWYRRWHEADCTGLDADVVRFSPDEDDPYNVRRLNRLANRLTANLAENVTATELVDAALANDTPPWFIAADRDFLIHLVEEIR